MNVEMYLGQPPQNVIDWVMNQYVASLTHVKYTASSGRGDARISIDGVLA